MGVWERKLYRMKDLIGASDIVTLTMPIKVQMNISMGIKTTDISALSKSFNLIFVPIPLFSGL